MELEDSLFPLLREVSIGIDPYEVFQDVEWALLIGAKPRGPGMERAGLLDINGQIFAEQVLLIFRFCCHSISYNQCQKRKKQEKKAASWSFPLIKTVV